jgi:hypothetical protein
MSQTISSDLSVGLYRCLRDWGEGTSLDPGPGGAGAPATPGDATWIHTFYDTQFWSAPGGSAITGSPDFIGTPSATATIGSVFQRYAWGPTEGMAADARLWLTQPAANFGWMLIADETLPTTAKRFDSRESPTLESRPFLRVSYVPPPCYANCDQSTAHPCLNVQDFICFLNRFAAADTYANCDLSTTPPTLNVLDFGCFLNRFGAGCPGC